MERVHSINSNEAFNSKILLYDWSHAKTVCDFKMHLLAWWRPTATYAGLLNFDRPTSLITPSLFMLSTLSYNHQSIADPLLNVMKLHHLYMHCIKQVTIIHSHNAILDWNFQNHTSMLSLTE